MPGKHIRFDDVANTVFKQTPRTPPYQQPLPLPSNYGASSSVPSQYGSFCAPLPGCMTTLHPVLALSQVPQLRFDVSLPPVNITPNNRSVSPHVFSDPATNPALPLLIISSAAFPWRVDVRPKSGSPFVTVADVVEQIYTFLRTNVSEKECNKLQLPPQTLKSVYRAFHERYQRIPDPVKLKEERDKGLKRVDFLQGHHTFMGLATTGGDRMPDVWQLFVS
ncbi:uncharacterized protein EV420DRAFT_1602119 [Desarmillaria tabescens]|uniref:DUF6699 domain-containing protein n=1 Tax=Armillaria tabescens TaxID=1929756 RepID=A0AA39IYX3_ARMTA|nr:uncharacterized protein EV420DRAFT_1602119 [Desarmillaria tabescens]KAK0433057.1 hypothetical protein EV420DRAFT_1602119 [Desarmillaria tabescens]